MYKRQELGRLLGGKIQDYGKGQQLLHEGDTIGQLGIVLEGEVRIVRIDMDGNERLFQKLIPSYMPVSYTHLDVYKRQGLMPILILFVFLQKYFIKGMLSGALK